MGRPDDALADDDADNEAMRRLMDGDDGLFGDLVSRWSVRMRGWIRRMGVSGADIDDIEQEVWLRVVRFASMYRCRVFRSWLTFVSRNAVIDHRRQMSRKVQSCSLSVSYDPSGECCMPVCEIDEMIEVISECAVAIAGERRAVILLKRLSGEEVDPEVNPATARWIASNYREKLRRTVLTSFE